MFEYSCEFFLTVKDEKNPILHNRYDAYDILLVSELPNLWDFVEFSCDFYFDHPEFDKLEDGEYLVYARGIAEFESDRDWESGIEEGHYLLGIDKLKIIPWKDNDDV